MEAVLDRPLTKRESALVANITNPKIKTKREAAIKAGYSERTASEIAYENLNKPHLRQAVIKRQQMIEQKATTKAVNAYEEFAKNLEFVSKLRDASHKWLDATNTGEYHIEPRAEEIDIVHYDYELKQPVTERLDAVLARLADAGIPKPSPFIKTTDLREYALKVIDRIDTTLDKFAKMGGLYTKEAENPANIEQSMAIVRQLLNLATLFDDLYHNGAEPNDPRFMPMDIEALTSQIKRLQLPGDVTAEGLLARVMGEGE